MVLYWRERRLAFIGDLVIGNPPGRCSLLPDEKMDDPARLRASVKTLMDLELDCLIMGDGVSIMETPSRYCGILSRGFQTSLSVRAPGPVGRCPDTIACRLIDAILL